MDGVQILRELKKIKPEIKVILITAYRDAEKAVTAFRLGVVDCLFKPFKLEALKKSLLANL